MKNRASTHLLLLLLIAGFEVVGYVAVYDSALLRGYEPSLVGAVRDLLMYVPIIGLLFCLSRVDEFRGADAYTRPSCSSPSGARTSTVLRRP